MRGIMGRRNIGGDSTKLWRRAGAILFILRAFCHNASSNARPSLEIVHPARTRFELFIQDVLFQRDLSGLGSYKGIAERRAILTDFPQPFNQLLLNIGKLGRPVRVIMNKRSMVGNNSGNYLCFATRLISASGTAIHLSLFLRILLTVLRSTLNI